MMTVYFLCRDCAKKDKHSQRKILAQDIEKYNPVMVERGDYITLLYCDSCGRLTDKFTMSAAIHIDE